MFFLCIFTTAVLSAHLFRPCIASFEERAKTSLVEEEYLALWWVVKGLIKAVAMAVAWSL